MIHLPFQLTGLLVWVTLAIAAVLNAFLRDGLIVPALGEAWRELGILTFWIMVYAITWLFLSRTPEPYSRADLWLLGFLWVVLAVGFEAVLVSAFTGGDWSGFAAAYDPSQGGLAGVMLLGVLLAPPLVGWRLARRAGG